VHRRMEHELFGRFWWFKKFKEFKQFKGFW